MNGHPPRSTRTDPLLPSPSLFRSAGGGGGGGGAASGWSLRKVCHLSGLTFRRPTSRAHEPGVPTTRDICPGRRGTRPSGAGQSIDRVSWSIAMRPERLAIAMKLALPRLVGATSLRSEEHTSELQSLMGITYADVVF